MTIMDYYKCQPPTEHANETYSKTESCCVDTRNRPTVHDHLSKQGAVERCVEQENGQHHSFNGSYGISQDGQTRISLQYMKEQAEGYRRIRDRMANVERAQAPRVLGEILDSSPDILLHYWKKEDKTLHEASPGDGACGWHTIAQIVSKDQTNSLLDLYAPRGILKAAANLEEIAANNNELTMETREALLYATDWMKKKSKNMRAQMNSDRELCSDNLAVYIPNIPATLFIQPSLAVEGAVPYMPDDVKSEWLVLHSTTLINNLDPETYTNAFPKIIIDLIARVESFVQLAGSHYFLFPDLPFEAEQCRTALEQLAFQIWDSMLGFHTN
jgi:hypothetical protein